MGVLGSVYFPKSSHRALCGAQPLIALWVCDSPCLHSSQQVRGTTNTSSVVVPPPLLPRGEVLVTHIC